MNHSADAPLSNPKYKEAFERTLERVHHEDTMIDRRFSWLLTSQSILIATYALSEQLHSSAREYIIPLAMVTGFVNYASLLAALFAIYAFLKRLDEKFSQYSQFSKDNILGPTATHLIGQSSAFILPIAILSTWVYLETGEATWTVMATGALLLIVVVLWQVYYPYRSRLRVRRLSNRRQRKPRAKTRHAVG